MLDIHAVARKVRFYLRHKSHQTSRLSRKSLEFACLLIGAAWVALFSLGFALLADLGLEWNAHWTAKHPYLAWLILPFGLTALSWFTAKYTPYVAGSGIPQVIASIALPHGSNKTRLVAFGQTLWKIPLTFFAMLLGASVGREGPSVQVGAAVMLAWGNFCRKHNLAFKGLSSNELMATGAAGGLAAAFNAPLAGVIFAIEELGRGVLLRWERRVLLGVLAAGFILVAIMGNNPYFPHYSGATSVPYMYLWVLCCAAVCGVFGGLFARLLGKGLAAYSPAKWRGWIRRHPLGIAFLLGLGLAALGSYSNGNTYGTGYQVVTELLNDTPLPNEGLGIAKLFATVATYWAGIAGGIFTPALTTGAALGAQIWEITDGVVDQRLLVLLSMAAFLAAATQSPVTASVVVMEMTGSQPVLFWLLVCSLLASLVSRQFCPKPFYHFAAGRFRQRIQQDHDSTQAKTTATP
ncbi:H+/Cl-antiporter ClcA [Pasteurella testudinis DSM 23072]|uniref:H+/Cl-antiporter ClcA n=1 Tax=Pasteurella testudinis DSM 23072 TaxID=1122938 RepID=A0A1W1V2R3_9PAST|nr:chloride channel protein [Pasteurella testudinis]SMB87588.1 H+/Cl-antiporter ClcA [Pasteurella testudinis DSM 23072]SUB50502.1 chloride channel, voltage gated family protein [Pasteurella testudinis]